MPPFRPDTPCETQELPNLDTKPGLPPRQVDTRSDSKAVQQRTERARAVALALKQVQLLAKGDRKTKVLDRDLTKAQLKKAGTR
jgi:hypothetical protein